jgi:hypothetical protein
MFEKEEMQNDVDSAMNHIPCPYSICHTDLCLFLVRVLGLVHDSLERRQGGGGNKETHQRVITTRWWSFEGRWTWERWWVVVEEVERWWEVVEEVTRWWWE